jgi:ribosomal 30S subunit maturation factor RimM
VLGEIVEVMDLPAQDVWVIHGPAPGGGRREILLPAAEPVVLEVDLAQKFAIVAPPAGLIDP